MRGVADWPGKRRTGFTLIELLVVIAIIAILIGLLVPAVQKVRGSAWRVQCQNNMKQIGQGAHTYHGTYKVFPPGFVTAPVPENNGVFIALLPFIEQQAIYNNWVFKPAGSQNWGVTATASTKGAANIIQVLLCPTGGGAPAITENWSGYNMGLTCYLANAGTQSYAVQSKDGIFYENSKTKIGHIKDGTSNTILFGERNYAQPDVNGCSLDTWDWGAWGAATGVIYDMGDSHGSSRVAINTVCSSTVGQDDRLNAFGSLHTGGANFVFGDGSVRFLPTSTDLITLQAMSTRAGGEPITEP